MEAKQPTRQSYHLSNPDTKQDVINRLALNDNQTDIANDVGLTRQSISTFKKRNIEAIKLIEQQFIDDNIINIRNQIKTDIDTSNKISQSYAEGNDFHPDATSFKAMVMKEMIKPILVKANLFSTPAQINNNYGVINNTSNTQVNPAILNVIGSKCIEQLAAAGQDDDVEAEIMLNIT